MEIISRKAEDQQLRLPRRPTMAFTWVDIKTGELIETHKFCGCDEQHPGIPCVIDRLIWDKKYRPKYRRMIQHHQGPYLLAAAQYIRDHFDEIPQPERYFARMCSK